MKLNSLFYASSLFTVLRLFTVLTTPFSLLVLLCTESSLYGWPFCNNSQINAPAAVHLSSPLKSNNFTLMLDPAGDAQYTGRVIDDCFERGITLQFAQSLKQELEQYYSSLRVILTRFPGEAIEPLQNAAFANRLNTDLYISIYFYPIDTPTQELYIYRFSANPAVDKIITSNSLNNLTLYPYNQAYKYAIDTTNKYSMILNKRASINAQKSSFIYKGLYALPCKPLIGITAPCFIFEMSLHKKEDYKKWIKPLVTIINSLYEDIRYTEKRLKE